MKIQVTQDHIKYGVPEDEYRCPIAFALIDAGLEKPYVDNGLVATDNPVESAQESVPRMTMRATPEIKTFVNELR